MDFTRFEGTAHNRTALLMVFAIAIAVTSIPVISRIMLDLGLRGSRFAGIVLSVAVIEDVVLYVALAVAVGMVADPGTAQFGLAGTLGWDPGSAANSAYHTVATVAFLGAALLAGPRVYGALMRSRYNLIKRRSQVAFQLVFMIVMSGLCLLLSIVPLFGAFVAGILVVSVPGEREEIARSEIGAVALGLFIPVYFAIVGLQLDLVENFDFLFFVGFLLFACLAKSASVYAGASRGRAGAKRRRSRHRDERPWRARNRARLDCVRRRDHRRPLLHDARHAGDRHLPDRGHVAPARYGGVGPARARGRRRDCDGVTSRGKRYRRPGALKIGKILR